MNIINPKIEEILQEFNITREDGLSYLLSIYYDVRPSYTPPLLIQRMNTTNILGLDENKMLVWRFPLFLNDDNMSSDKWSWTSEWMDMFKDVNKDRRGASRSVKTRMMVFFSENPDVRKEEVFEATKMYLRSLTSPTFCKKSHKFICEGSGKFRVSLLEEWVEKYREYYAVSDEPQTSSNSLNNTMQ